MSIYTVYAPPLREGEAATDPERFVFVRDGFSWPAFLFAPLWMVAHRLWLSLIGLVAVAVLLFAALRFARIGSDAASIAGLLYMLLIGFEAGTLRRWTLRRNGWRELGIVVGETLETAERRFFAAWTTERPAVSGPTPPSPRRTPPPGVVSRGSDVVGLFPEPGAPR